MNRERFKLPKNQLNIYYYFLMLIILNVMLYIAKPDFAYIGIALSVILIVYTLLRGFDQRNKWDRFLQETNEMLLRSENSTLLSVPVPLLVVAEDGEIIWYNSKFRQNLGSEDEIIGEKVENIFRHWNWEKMKKSEEHFFEEKLKDHYFSVFQSHTLEEDDNIYTFFWYDETPYHQLLQSYRDEKPLIVYVQVDNYDEVMASAKQGMEPFIISEIHSTIKSWSEEHNAILQSIDDDEFIMLVEQRHMDNIEARRFTILDEIRKISAGNKNPITLSIGLGADGVTMQEREQSSRTALELALGRGGDQAVIRKDGRYEFFGGRSKHVERMSRVRSRVVAQGLATLMRESRNIYIMGHRYPDLDSFASSIGVYRCAINLEKEAFIVLNEVPETIEDLYRFFGEDPLYRFVKGSDIKVRIGEEDLLIVVDTHRPNFTEDPEILSLFKNRVVIDHHRRGTEVIENLALFYLEPYASSASEMVTEILQYLTDRPRIEDIESNALLAGIILDTKNFIFNTGVRTFDAASFLRRNGADTQKVREFFKDDFSEIITKSAIITNAQLVAPGILLSVNDEAAENIKKIISQGADELIDIRDIHTSFVIGKDPSGTVFISGRSNGSTNVQVILEKIGGGGHLETAGAQFSDKDVEEVRQLLIGAIEKYREES